MRMFWIPFLVTAASVSVLIWGWVQGSGGVPFARSGALVTALSVAFLFWQYGKILSERQKVISDKLRLIVDNLTYSAEHKKFVAGQGDEIFRVSIRQRERSITFIQGVQIIVGTIVWGF